MMNLRNNQNRLLAKIGNGISANAASLQRLDLARIGRRAEAACQFEQILAGLKQQIALKAAAHAQTSFAAAGPELQTLAA
jgi:hypothetical protein